MSFDRSWRIRKQFADFISLFLEPLDEYRQHLELHQSNFAEFPISDRAKRIKMAFKTILADMTLEILSDSDD